MLAKLTTYRHAATWRFAAWFGEEGVTLYEAKQAAVVSACTPGRTWNDEKLWEKASERLIIYERKTGLVCSRDCLQSLSNPEAAR